MVSEEGTPGILVNRVECSWDSCRFAERFGVIRVEAPKGTGPGAAADALAGVGPAVRSTVYGFGGKEFHALVDRGRVGDALDALGSLEGVLAKAVPVGSLPKRTVLNLLAAALPDVRGGDGPSQRLSNPEGCLYCVDPADVKRGRVVAMKFWFSESRSCFGDIMLEFPAASFAELSRVSRDPGNAKVIGRLAHYRCEGGYLRRTGGCGPRSAQGDVYVRRGFAGMKKAGIPFFDVSSVNGMYRSKIGRVYRILRTMRREYADLGLDIGLVRTTRFDDHRVVKAKSTADRFQAVVSEEASARGVRIVDPLGTPESARAAGSLAEAFSSLSVRDVSLSGAPEEGRLNVVLVEHSSGDPGHSVSAGTTLQHVSMEGFAAVLPSDDDGEGISKGLSDRASVILSEALIKQGLIEGLDPFFGWFTREVCAGSAYDRAWTFVHRPRVRSAGGGPEWALGPMYCLTLGLHGEISCRTYEAAPDDPGMAILWGAFDPNDADCRGIATDGESAFEFRRSDVVAIPEAEVVKRQLESGNLPRRVAEVELGLKACTDVRYCVDRDDSCYYMVGVRSRGMESKIQWGAHVYEMRRLDGTGEPPAVLFDMLQVPFVRYKRMTTVPYPFKYLREYELMQGLERLQGVGPEDVEDEPEEDSGGFTQMVLEDFLPGLRRRPEVGRRPLRAAETFSPRNPAPSPIRVDTSACLHRFSQMIRQIKK